MNTMKKYTITLVVLYIMNSIGTFLQKQDDVMIVQKLEQIIIEFVDMFMLVGLYAYQARPKMAIQESIFCDFAMI